MKRKTYLGLVATVCAAVWTAAVQAEQEQWLSYSSSQEVGRGISMGYQLIMLSADRPPGVGLPQFKGARPLFTMWPTPMAERGYLWIALDCAKRSGQYDALYIDSNGDSRLDDEAPVTAYRMDQMVSYFGPAKVVFKAADGPVTYHLNMQFRRDMDQFLFIYSGG